MTARIPFRLEESIQLQRLGDHGNGRFVVPLYGVCGDASLITGAPRLNGKYVVVNEGQLFAARMMAGGCAYGFQTEVLCSRTRPTPYLHLRYPRQFEKREVRNSVRVSVRLPLVLRRLIDGKPGQRSMPATALDISRTGLLAACAKPALACGDTVNISTELRVADATRELNLAAVVRNINETPSSDVNAGWRMGLQFEDLAGDDAVMLTSFVNEQIVAGWV
jgi:c-di-GMP-binding flagellar brake protein YcgR